MEVLRMKAHGEQRLSRSQVPGCVGHRSVPVTWQLRSNAPQEVNAISRNHAASKCDGSVH